MKTAYLLAAFAPLFGAVVAGFFGRRIGRAGAHWVTILGVAVSMFASFWVLRDVLAGNTFNGTLYAWSVIGDLKLEVGEEINAAPLGVTCHQFREMLDEQRSQGIVAATGIAPAEDQRRRGQDR